MRGIRILLWTCWLLVNGSWSWHNSPTSSRQPGRELIHVRGMQRRQHVVLPRINNQNKQQEQAESSLSELQMVSDSSPSHGDSIEQGLSTNTQGILFMTLASLSFSLMFLGVKLYSNAPTFTLVFYRSIVQAILSGLLLQQQGKHPLGPANVRGLLTLRGTTGSLAVAALFFAVQNLPLPDAITLQFTTPVFAALLAVPMLGEPWKRSNMWGAAFCLSGVLMIARPSWLFGAASSTATSTIATTSAATATLVGLMGAAFAAGAYVLVRKIGARADANIMVFYYAVISALTAPLGARLLDSSSGASDATMLSSWNVVGKPSVQELFVFAGLGVSGFFGQLFTNIGLKRAESAATATLVTNTQIVFAFLFEITILHESLSPWSLAGTALIVGYMVFAGINMIGREKKAADLNKASKDK